MTKEIDHAIERTLTTAEVGQLQNFVTNASTGVVGVINTDNPNTKVYFVGFDGTGNNKYNSDLAPTNISQLFDLAKTGLDATSSGIAKYYQGPGTQDNIILNKLDGLTGTTMFTTAAKAYTEFETWANEQYRLNPNVDITLAGASFSRGGGTHTAFLNLVYEKGIPDTSSAPITEYNPNSEQFEIVGYSRYIVAPGQADLGVQVFYDRVVTGGRTDATTLLPPSDKLQVLSILMNDEHRMDFKADSLQNPDTPDVRVNQTTLPGAHSDGGGGYWDDGISLYTLEGAYKWLSASGVPLAALPDSLKGGAVISTIHDSFKGFWGIDGGPDVAGWFEDRSENINYYKNPTVVHNATPPENNDATTVTSIDDTSWKGVSSDQASQVANLVHKIDASATANSVSSSIISAALDLLTGDVEAYTDSKGNLIITGDNGIVQVDRKGNASLRIEGSDSTTEKTYSAGQLTQVVTTNAPIDGTVKIEIATSDGKIKVINVASDNTLDVHTQIGANDVPVVLGMEQDENGAWNVTNVVSINGAAPLDPALTREALIDAGFDPFTGQYSGDAAVILAAEDATNTSYQYTPSDPQGSGLTDAAAAGIAGRISTVTSMIEALKSGNPLPIATSFFNLAALTSNDSGLGDISTGLNDLTSLLNFRRALQQGDLLQAVPSGVAVVQNVLKLYQSYLKTQMIAQYGNMADVELMAAAGSEEAQAALAEYSELGTAISEINTAIPYIGAAVSIFTAFDSEHPNYMDVIMACVACIPVFGQIVYAAYSADKVVHQIGDKAIGHDATEVIFGPLEEITKAEIKNKAKLLPLVAITARAERGFLPTTLEERHAMNDAVFEMRGVR